MDHYIASVSGGKDSLAMFLRLIEDNCPLDEVMFYDTGKEFNGVYAVLKDVERICKEHGITFTTLRPEVPFDYKMFEKPVTERNGGGIHLGYSWCGGQCRWGTTEKLKAMDDYAESKNAKVYIGIAADEEQRIYKDRKPYKLFPLVTWKMSEVDCLTFCYQRRYTWAESGRDGETKLYDILDRASCWCCSNKNLKELRNIYHYLPEYWERLKVMQSALNRPMKGKDKSVFDLEVRFIFEDERLSEGLSITDHDFYEQLKRRLHHENN